MIKLQSNARLVKLSKVLDKVIANYKPPGRLIGEKQEPKISKEDLLDKMKKGDIIVAPDVYAYFIDIARDAEIKEAAQGLFPNSEFLSISGKFHYPPHGFMGWHNNGNMIGWRVYASKVDETHKSFFRYYKKGEVITELEEKGWNFRAFQIQKNKSYWHCVHTDIDIDIVLVLDFRQVKMRFKEGDKVVVNGLDLAFVVFCYLDDDLVRLYLEGEDQNTTHYVIHARPEVLLPNNYETLISQKWV